MVSIVVNEKLFDRWQQLGSRISRQASIVQNNMVVDAEEIIKWHNMMTSLQRELLRLEADTLRHCNMAHILGG